MTYAVASPRRFRSRATKAMAALVGLALTVTLAACAPAPSPTTSEALRTLSIGATLEPASLDPWHNPAASIPQVMLYNVYETLVKVDSNGGIKPLLAQAWEVSPDRTTYTFHLNPAAKFASGAPVDAAAVVANINRLKSDAKITETLRAQLEVVAGAEATGTDRVQVTLTRPSLMWLYDMSSTLGISSTRPSPATWPRPAAAPARTPSRRTTRATASSWRATPSTGATRHASMRSPFGTSPTRAR